MAGERRYPLRIRKERFTISKTALVASLLTLETVESMGIGQMSTSVTSASHSERVVALDYIDG
jgi:hypothetical protein